MSRRFEDALRKLTQRLTSRQIVRLTSTAQLVPGDVVLMKNDTFQGKPKVKDRWSETEHVVVCQVADGMPAYKVKDEAGNIKTIHQTDYS